MWSRAPHTPSMHPDHLQFENPLFMWGLYTVPAPPPMALAPGLSLGLTPGLI